MPNNTKFEKIRTATDLKLLGEQYILLGQNRYNEFAKLQNIQGFATEIYDISLQNMSIRYGLSTNKSLRMGRIIEMSPSEKNLVPILLIEVVDSNNKTFFVDSKGYIFDIEHNRQIGFTSRPCRTENINIPPQYKPNNISHVIKYNDTSSATQNVVPNLLINAYASAQLENKVLNKKDIKNETYLASQQLVSIEKSHNSWWKKIAKLLRRGREQR